MDKAWEAFLENKSDIIERQLSIAGDAVGKITKVGDRKDMCMYFVDLHVRTPQGEDVVYSVNTEIDDRHPRPSPNGLALVFTQHNMLYVMPIEGVILLN